MAKQGADDRTIEDEIAEKKALIETLNARGDRDARVEAQRLMNELSELEREKQQRDS